MTEPYVWTDTDEDEAVRGLSQLGREFPGLEVTVRWYGESGPGVSHLTAVWEGREVRAFTVDGIRAALLHPPR